MKTQYPIEAYTLSFNYLKHISLLSTGSILIIVAFLEKLFLIPEWNFLIGISLVSFLFSVLFSIFAQYGVIDIVDDSNKVSARSEVIGGISLILTLGFFALGLITMIIFAIKNLY